MTRLARTVGAVVAVGLALGCTGSAAEGQRAEDRLRPSVVECRDVIDAIDGPVPGYTAHGSGRGFVALPSGAMQLGRFGPEGSGYEDFRFAKFGLLVRQSQQASLEIAKAQGDAFFDYGRDEFGSAAAVTVGPCATRGPPCEVGSDDYVSGWPCGFDRGEWIVWAGGIWVNEPGCVEVLASSDDEEITVRLAVAASCE